MMKAPFGLLVPLVLAFAVTEAIAADYYVAPNGNDSDPGTLQKPWKSIGKANSALQPGDTVYLRAGTYNESIKPNRSGNSENQRIIFKAYPGERPVIKRVSTGVDLVGKNYITIDGIDMDGEIVRGAHGGWPGIGGGSSNIQNFAFIDNSNYNVIQNVFWQKAHGWAGIKVLNGSHHNKILNSTFDFVGTYDNGTGDDPGDIIQIKESAEHNLIEGNTLKHGGHNLIEMGGRYNVVRNNIFNNDWSDYLGGNKGNRALSLKGEGPSGYTGGYNLFEGNIITNAKPASDNPRPPAMKVIGEGQIVRRNFILNNYGNGIITANGGGASNGYVSKNRIFHNVFYNQGGSAWNLSWNDGNGVTLDDNIFKNNIVYKNRQDPEKTKLDADVTFDSSTSPLRDNKVIGNLFFKSSPGDGMIYSPEADRDSISKYQNMYPNNFSKNLAVNPGFIKSSPVDIDDFALTSSSAAVDSGEPLTSTRSGGSGTKIPVKDAHYFSDGFGVVAGDEIRVGSNASVRVVAVDYKNNELTVDTNLSWSSGDAVSLNFTGNAPDIGAFELGLSNGTGSGGTALQPPPPPTNLQLISG